jgi:hypothetical protein
LLRLALGVFRAFLRRMLQVKPDMPPPHPLSHPAKNPAADFIVALRQLDTSQAGLEQGLQLILDELVAVVTGAATFRPLIVELIELVVARVARRAD